MNLSLKDSGLLRNQALINGQWLSADDGTCFDVNNPANGELITQCASVGVIETRRAIDAAAAAMPAWQKQTARQRANVMRKWFELILEHQEDLAKILTHEQGKPLAEARGEVGFGASFIEWFAEEANRMYGETIPTIANDRRFITIKQAVGVVAAITPWNFPFAMIARKAGPALAAGCAIVIKPASETPLSALAIAELACRAGIPDGIVNVITGDAATVGAELTANPVVRKLSFTGSTRIGKLLLKQCAENVKKVSMELGGDAPVIVYDDADLDAAVDGAIASKYRNAGQTCVCANRIMVQDGIYDDFIALFTKKVAAMTMGEGTQEGVDLGPMIHTRAVQNMQALVSDALEKGANMVLGGQATPNDELYYPATILTNISDDMRVAQEEIFGPIAPVFRFSSEEESIRKANDTEYGLASYIYTRDIGRIWRVSEQLEYGMVGINETGISNYAIPFGGVKESGSGREGSLHGIDDYTEIKYLCMGGIDS